MSKPNGLPVIRAARFYKELRAGSSLPLLVGGDDGHSYVVKLNGAGDGVLSNVAEWLSSRLGEFMQIPILPPVFVFIDANFANQAGDPETRELLEKSVGVNLGTPYLPDASTYSARHAPGIGDFLKQQIFLYDLFLLNVDRTAMNPNMIVQNGKLWCLDYSSAMEMRSAITGESYREYILLKPLKRHPFYRENLDAYGFIKALQKIPDHRIHAIVDEIPAPGIGHLKLAQRAAEARSVITTKLIDKKLHGMTPRNRLDLLRVLKVETDEEERRKALENRKAFAQKYGSLQRFSIECSCYDIAAMPKPTTNIFFRDLSECLFHGASQRTHCIGFDFT